MTTFCIGNINPGTVHSAYMASMMNFMGAVPRTDNSGYVANLMKNDAGPYLDAERNHIVSTFLEQEANVLLFIDSDIQFEPDDVWEMVNYTALAGGVNAGWYTNYFPEHGYRPVAFDWNDTDTRMVPIKNPNPEAKHPVSCGGVGTGFMAIRRDVLDAMTHTYAKPTPWFAELVKNECLLGEDLTFCQRAVDLGFPVRLLPWVKVKHHKTMILDPAVHH